MLAALIGVAVAKMWLGLSWTISIIIGAAIWLSGMLMAGFTARLVEQGAP